MKKSLCVVLILSLLLCMVFIVAGYKNVEPAWADMPENTNPNFKYFGYYHFSNAIDEVASHGNVNLAKVDIECVDEIDHLYRKGFYILIMTRHIFFSSGETPTDWEQRWNTAKEIMQPYLDRIIGFYVDEPLWTGKSMESFHFSCQTVRNDYPDKRMMAMLSYGALTMSEFLWGIDVAEYCKYCTDIGWDFYRPWDKEGVLSDLEIVKTKIAIYGQDIWMSPKGFYVIDKNKSLNWFWENSRLAPGEDIINWIKGSYEIAVNEPRIVGHFTFCYGDDSSEEKYDYYLYKFFNKDDAAYRKDIKDLYIQIGKAVIANCD